MSANAANVELSYSEGELPPRTPPPAATTSAPPTEKSEEAANPTDASTAPPATSALDVTSPTGQPSVAGPSTAESPVKEKPRFSAVGKTLWVTAANQSAEPQPPVAEPSAAEPPISADTPVSATAKLTGVSAGTQTPTRPDGKSPAEANGKASLKAELSEKQRGYSESTEAVEDEEERLVPSGSIFLDHVRTLPVVRCSTAVYKRAKSNGLLATPLALMECAASVATVPVRVAAWPFATLCPTSLFLLDWTLYKGLDAVLAVCPCIAAGLNQFCPETKRCCVNCVCCCPRAINKAVSAVCPKHKST